MKIWITKHALSKGVIEVEAEPHLTVKGLMVAPAPEGETGVSFFYRSSWHPTWEEALANAEKQRERYLKMSRAMVTKMENLKFTKP